MDANPMTELQGKIDAAGKVHLIPDDLTNLPAHEYAGMFPMIDEDQRKAFREDIQNNGLTDEIVLLNGSILDGRNRYRELKILGWEVQRHYYITWQELVRRKGLKDDPFAYVVSKNLRRRHLTDSQRAMAAARAATMRQGERTDITALPFDNSPSANVRKVSQGEAAEMFDVSDRLVSSANAVLKTGIGKLQELVDTAQVVVSVAEEIARMPAADQERALAENKPAALKTVAKRFDRERRARELAGKQAALPIKKYGIILSDNEWDFLTRSENGRDRSPGYPVSSLEELMARRVGDIAAPDCVLFMWATVPMLIEAIICAEAWGFMLLTRDDVTGHLAIDKSRARYVSHWAWVKDKIITGYWGRGKHELLLIFTRGNPVAPAMGTQPASVVEGPVDLEPAIANAKPWKAGEHSAKPDLFMDWIDRLFPDAAKIELNARQARPGWDRWGNEAPEVDRNGMVDVGNGTMVAAEFATDEERAAARQKVENSGAEDPLRNEVAPKGRNKRPVPASIEQNHSKPTPKSKLTAAEKWKAGHERDAAADETVLRSLSRDVPEDHAGRVAAYRAAIDAMDAAVVAGDKKAAKAARDRQRAILFAANGGTEFGVAVNVQAQAIEREASVRANPNAGRLKYGATGAFRVAIDDPPVRAIVLFHHWHDDGRRVDIAVHATTVKEPFPSPTGYHGVMGLDCLGKPIADAAIEAVEYVIRYATDKKFNSYADGFKLPERAYQISGDGVDVLTIPGSDDFPPPAEELPPLMSPGPAARKPRTSRKAKTDAKS
jgi:N6-adenosine-specific RNA methylase IME4